jgi:glutathione S-transferase
MSITVYNISGSPMGWRVLLGLEFKGLEYRCVYLSGSDREHKQAAFLHKNPHGKVPVLEHEGIYYRESLAILGWLDEHFPERPLFGSTIQDVQQTWKITARLCDYLLKSTSDVVFPVFNGADGSPKIESDGEALLDRDCGHLNVELHDIEHRLGDRQYLCGDRPSAADAVAFPEIGRIMRACQTKPRSMKALGYAAFDQGFPNIAKWRDRIVALPGHARTVPPHWLATS